MNIGLFISSLGGGGAERVVSRLSKIFSKEHQVYIMVIDAGNICYECQGEILDLGEGRQGYYSKAFNAFNTINRVIEEKEIDHLISFLDIPNIINALFVKGTRRYVSIRSFHGKNTEKGIKERLRNVLRKFSYKRADKVVFISMAQADIMGSEFMIPEEKRVVISNPYDREEIEADSQGEVSEAADLFFRNYDVACAMGRLCEVKGYKYLLGGLRQVAGKVPRAGLMFIGDGPLKDDLMDEAERLGVSERVFFAGRQENPFPYLKRSKLFLGMSLHEGFPNALTEAMCCGLPVIHTDCRTGPGEILRKKYVRTQVKEISYADYGVLLPDIMYMDEAGRMKAGREMAEPWRKFLQNNSLREEFGSRALSRSEYFSTDACMEKYRELFGEEQEGKNGF